MGEHRHIATAVLACLLSGFGTSSLPSAFAAASEPQNFRYDVLAGLLTWDPPLVTGGWAVTGYRMYVKVGGPVTPCPPQAQPGVVCSYADEELVGTGDCANLVGTDRSCKPSGCPVRNKCYYRLSAVTADGQEGAKSHTTWVPSALQQV